jgi:hypothetical protein
MKALAAAAALFGILLLSVALPAPAQAATAPDSVPAIAADLRSEPLYVHPDMTWLLPPAAQRRIEHALRAEPVRVFVVAVPLNVEQDPNYYAYEFIDLLYRQTHLAGVYLVISPSGFIYDAEYLVPLSINSPWNEDPPGPALGLIAATMPVRILNLLNDIATSPRDPRQAVSPTPAYLPYTAPAPGYDPPLVYFIMGVILGLLFAGPLLALASFRAFRAGRALVAGRRGSGDAGYPGIPAGRMPTSPSARWLRRHAAAELAALWRRMSASSADNPGWRRACDNYDVAMLLRTDAAAEQIDLAGAIVLAREGRLALEWRTAQPPPSCQVNPLHGRSMTSTSVPARLVPGLRTTLPMCARCARRLPSRWRVRIDPTLRVKHGGERVRYTSFNSIWVDTAFGAVSAHQDISLPQAIREHLGVS